jgi:hypothetical protein
MMLLGVMVLLLAAAVVAVPLCCHRVQTASWQNTLRATCISIISTFRAHCIA